MRRRRVYLEIAVFALGLLSAIRDVRATEAPDGHLSLGLPLQTSDNFRFGAFTESSDGEESASELNRKLTNPVSDIWSISNQFNNFELNNGHWNNNWNFQPVLPVSLTKDWNLITRPVMPFYNIVPHETAQGQFERDAGLGGLTLLELLSPAHSGNWVLGAGPTFIFPTATSGFTGQGKWQAGPSIVLGYLTKKFFIGVFPQRDYLLFHEYFHGDNGAGVGASHQTGWTGLVGKLIELYGYLDPKKMLEAGRAAAFVRQGQV